MDLKTVHVGIHKNRKRKRVGRGVGSKRGKTATRGAKGQWARTGGSVALMKEGGQMPRFRRVAKRGFNNSFGLEVAVVNVVDLENFDDGAKVGPSELTSSGLVNRRHDRIKILGDGDLTRKYEVHAHAFSKQAREKIEKAGGKCVELPPPARGPKVKNKMRPRKPKNPLL